MKKYIFVCLLLLLFAVSGMAQMYFVTGIVYDENGDPLPGCHVHYKDLCDVTNAEGTFIHEVKEGKSGFGFSFIGYSQKDTFFTVTQDVRLEIVLQPDNQIITEIAVLGNSISTTKTKKNEVVNADFVSQNLTGTFIKSIERLPGVNAMDIGANASKPIIRGMSFNRVVVSENGVKQEGQQWGADHGLELDPFSIETAEIVKGASGIEHGSDAIGGYINITNNKLPAKHSFNGEASFITKSVNDTYGGSVFLKGRSDKYFFKARASMLDFGDYSIPTDNITYLTQIMPVYNNRLKNTAGVERDMSLSVGRVSDIYKTIFSISNVYQKSGFFPGAHGIPDKERVKHDGDYRNIGYPFQKVNHLKFLSQTKFFLSNGNVVMDLGYQDNVRQEWSAFHTHYPDQEIPDEDANLELDFGLKTYSGNLKYTVNSTLLGKLNVGFQSQLKDNNVGGYNFLLPEYESLSLGGFVQSEYSLNDRLKVNGGIRYDWSEVNTHAFYDDVLHQYFTSKGDSEAEVSKYAQRSTELNKNYGDISWLIGLVFKPNNNMVTRMNVGKAFRMPTAIELGSNGIHHGSFRHEVGNESLDSEKGYYIDGNLEWNSKVWQLELSPYLYYFSNYLYLQPTGEFSRLPHAGQLYRYAQTEALLTGVELSINRKLFDDKMSALLTMEYIYNQKISSDKSQRYPLPFTPPINGFIELDYHLSSTADWMNNTRFFLNSRFALRQNRISNNEEETDGYIVFGAGISTDISIASQEVNLVLQGNNLLNTKYFNHVSFYRKVEIPEQGRSIQVLLKVPF